MSRLIARAAAFVVAGLVFGLAGTGSPAMAETLQMQAAWPASQTLYDNFLMFADRVDKLSGGRLKIETLPAGTVVPPFELLDATNKRVVDGAHAWAGYWQGKNKTAILFTGGPGGTFGMDYIDYLGWMYEGGGLTSTRSSTATCSSSTSSPSRSCHPARRRSAGSRSRSRPSMT